MSSDSKLAVFAGSSSPELGAAIASHLGMALGDVELSRFANGEIYARFLDNVRGKHCFVIQTICPPVNYHLMELLIMIDALKRASASKISAVVPHYAYARQDKKMQGREPIAAKLVADLLSCAGIDRIVTMDLHAGQIQGFFDVPVDHLQALPLIANFFERKDLQDLVVVSPDVGRVKVAKRYADRLGAELAIIHKVRPKHNESEVAHIIGEVEGRTALVIDDMIDTGGTIINSVNAVKERGARDVFVGATHPVFSLDAVEKLEASLATEILVTDTLPLPKDKKTTKITVVSVAELFAQVIRSVYEFRSVSVYFKDGV